MERILLLVQAEHAFDAREVFESARRRAAGAKRLSFGLLTPFEPDEEEMEWLVSLGTVQYVAPTNNPWSDAASLWQGEDFILRLHAGARLMRNWDMTLLNALRDCPGRSEGHSILTGLPPEPVDPVDAIYPLAAESLSEDGMLQLRKGIPLRYAAHPERSAWMNPDFLFGPSAFWREMAEDNNEPCVRAYQLGWTLYTLNTACVHMVCPSPLPCFPIQRCETFEEGFLLFRKEHPDKLSTQARLGIFNTDLRFEMNFHRPVRLQQMALRAIRSHSKVSPLVVTRFCTDHGPDGHNPEEDFAAFRFLTKIEDLPLLCFSDSEAIAHLTPFFTNLLEYKRRYEIQLPQEVTASRAERVALSKMALMSVAREKQLNHTHYIWMNRGILRYPVAPFASPDWESLCHSRIVLATVDGVPDTSMIVIPELLLPNLNTAFAARVMNLLNETGHLPSEQEVWSGLIQDWPDAIMPIELPSPSALPDLLWLPRGVELMTRQTSPEGR